jgi:hypothetical protein
MQFKAWGQWITDREMRSILLLGVAFMLVYGAYDGQQFIVELSIRSILYNLPEATLLPFDGYYS